MVYLKAQQESLVIEPIEQLAPKEVKTRVYHRKRISDEDQKQLISKLVANIDIDFLCVHSASFRHFYTELQTHFTQY